MPLPLKKALSSSSASATKLPKIFNSKIKFEIHKKQHELGEKFMKNLLNPKLEKAAGEAARTAKREESMYLFKYSATEILERFLDIDQKKHSFKNILNLGAHSQYSSLEKEYIGKDYHSLLEWKHLYNTNATVVLKKKIHWKSRIEEEDSLEKKIEPIKLIAITEDESFQVSTINAGIQDSPNTLAPLADGSMDAVISNLALHWVNDLEGCLAEAARVLREDGVFIGTMIGGADTLCELRSSLQLAEQEVYKGISPHISPMIRVEDVPGLLSKAGLTLTTVDVDTLTIRYPSMFELMKDLQAMGESNAILDRKTYPGKALFKEASKIYDERYGGSGTVDNTASSDDSSNSKKESTEERGVPATFQIIYMIGWKPSSSQPLPLKRGSAKHSLKDIDKIQEFTPKE